MDHETPTFRHTDRDGTPTLEVAGEVDLACVAELREHLGALTGPTVAVDLSGVTFLDSSGLGVLIAAHKRARTGGTRLVVVAPSAPCRNVLEVSGAAQYLDILD